MSLIKKTAIIPALVGSLFFGGNALAQDKPIQIKGNPALEYLADSIGNQDGLVQEMEEDYLKEKFKNSDRVYAHSVASNFIYLLTKPMSKLYTSLSQAQENCVEKGFNKTNSIIEFDKNGEVKTFKGCSNPEEIRYDSGFDYNGAMENRKQKAREEYNRSLGLN